MYSKIEVQNPIGFIIENIVQAISASHIREDEKKSYHDRLSKIDFQLLEIAYKTSIVKISGKDMKYLICFAADIDANDVCRLFKVKRESVYTARYRIRKKFAKNDCFLAIL